MTEHEQSQFEKDLISRVTETLSTENVRLTDYNISDAINRSIRYLRSCEPYVSNDSLCTASTDHVFDAAKRIVKKQRATKSMKRYRATKINYNINKTVRISMTPEQHDQWLQHREYLTNQLLTYLNNEAQKKIDNDS